MAAGAVVFDDRQYINKYTKYNLLIPPSSP